MEPQPKYLVIVRWSSHETSVDRHDTLDAALAEYLEHLRQFSTPILAQEITPTLTATDLDGNSVSVKPTGT